jgi:hypothetical protein
MQNVIHFKATRTTSTVVFCMVDRIYTYNDGWTKEVVKNIADFTITNITGKYFDVLQAQDEDALLQAAVELGYQHAVVFSTGTEFINGGSFFNEIVNLSNQPYFIHGHILDRGAAYYELHEQCYMINLGEYAQLNMPAIGSVRLGEVHTECCPIRSVDNVHDDYTPLFIYSGELPTIYAHKLHGWNIVSQGLRAGKTIQAFDKLIRTHKKHYYPENKREFLNHIEWAHARHAYCMTDFIHTSNTDQFTDIDLSETCQIVTPASGTWWANGINRSVPVTVVMYDYNQAALDYWKNRVPLLDNVTYRFVRCDLLGVKVAASDLFDPSISNTVINLSNIFAYEGTAAFTPVEMRVHKEEQLIDTILRACPLATIHFAVRAAAGFVEYPTSVSKITINQLKKPTWRYGEWNE